MLTITSAGRQEGTTKAGISLRISSLHLCPQRAITKSMDGSMVGRKNRQAVGCMRWTGIRKSLAEMNDQSRNLAWNQQYPFWALLPAIPKKPACPAYGKYRFDPWPAASEAKAPSGAETMTAG